MNFKDIFKSKKSTEQNSVNSPDSKLTKQDLLIINQIVDEFKDRSRKQIKEWRDAMEATEDTDDPRWYLLQNLYSDTIDGHLSSVIDTREMATTNHKFYVEDKKTGEELIDQTGLLNKRWFFNFIKQCLEAITKKYSVVQLVKGDEYPVLSVIPRRNVCPQFKRVYLEVAGSEYVDYSEEPSVIEINHSSDFGILNDVIPNTIWKKNAMQSWAEFSERFGMPLVTASTSNTKDIARIETMLKKMGEAAQAVLPTGTTVEVHDTANKGDVEGVYEKQGEFHDNQISKRIIGGTMISDSGSSYSQSEVHERTLDDKISVADKRFVSFVVNDDLFPVLQSLGMPFDNTKMVFKFDDTEALSISDHWKIVNEAADKFEFDDKGVEWIAKTFRIPIVGIKQNTSSNFNQATSMMQAMAVACNVSLPVYPNVGINAASDLGKVFNDELTRFDNKINKFLYSGSVTDAEKQRLLKGKRIAEELRSGLFDSWKGRTNIAWNEPDHRALSAMEMNLFKFCDAKSQAEVLLLNRLLIDKEKNEIRSQADFIEKAKEINNKFNKTYLITERDLAVATGQNSARWFEFIREKDEIQTWQYQTVGDDHVRKEHDELDGRVFYFDDTMARKLWPPNGYKCRCEGVQYIGDAGDLLMSGKDAVPILFTDKKNMEQFAFNRAEEGVVFKQNQMYLNTLNGDVKDINDYNYQDFDRKDWKKMKGLQSINLDSTITPDNVNELFVNNAESKMGKAMGFDDYLGRKLLLREDVFKTHTTGKYVQESQKRHLLFAKIKDVLKTPGEVYLREKNSEQIRYIKFYKEQVVVVDTSITSNGLEIKTWYTQKIPEEKLRSGLWIN